MAHSSVGCTGNMAPGSAPGEDFRRLPVMVKGKGEAGVSHGKRGNKRGGGARLFLNNQLPHEQSKNSLITKEVVLSHS